MPTWREQPAPGLQSPQSPEVEATLARQRGGSPALIGRTLAHYRITAAIGAGGMGEVYRATDTKLGRDVALKVLPVEMAASSVRLDRFRREAKALAALDHPGIVTVYSVEEADGVPFLTMQLVEGQPLDRLISEDGLPVAALVVIAADLADAVAAAHEKGVVHRDLKPANVMVTKDGRVKVLDFGLAKVTASTQNAPADSELETEMRTLEGVVMGTVPYMSPEQISGRPVDHRTDVFSLGILLYEMASGRRPFQGRSAAELASAILRDAPRPLGEFRADLPAGLVQLIGRCLEKAPQGRPSAGDIRDALRGLTGVVSTSGRVASKSLDRLHEVAARRRTTVFVVGLLSVTTLGLLAGGLAWRRPSTARPAATAAGAVQEALPQHRPSVAILGLEDVSGQNDSAWLGTALAEMLAGDLSAGGRLRVIPSLEVARARNDLDLSAADVRELPPRVLERARRGLAVDAFLVGSYTVLGGAGQGVVRVDLRLQDAQTGALLASGNATGAEGQFFDVVSRASRPLRERLGLSTVTAGEAVEVESSYPTDPTAARLYTEGLVQLRAYDAEGARSTLERAIAKEPKHPMPHAALAQALQTLGYAERAAATARTAASLSDALPRESKLAIDALSLELEQQRPRAIEVRRQLVRLFPDDVDHHLRLIELQIAAGLAREALASAEALAALPKPVSDDPRIDLALASCHQALGEPAKQRERAAAAVERAGQRGLRGLEARARLVLAVALTDLGERDAARREAETARALAEAVGNRGLMARCLEQVSAIVQASGDLDGALRLNDSALEVYRASGDLAGVARVRQNQGLTLARLGRLAEAQQRYDEALGVFRRLEARHEIGVTLNNVGVRLQLAGDLEGAARRYREALDILGAVGDKRRTMVILGNLGEIEYERAELTRAEGLYQEALALCREVGESRFEGYFVFRLGEVAAARGDRSVARTRYEEALRALEAAADKLSASLVRVALARLAMAEHDLGASGAESAVSEAERAEETLRAEGAGDEAAVAQSVLARALLAVGRGAEAAELAKLVAGVAAKSEDRRVRLLSGALSAQLRASTGRSDDVAAALSELDRIAAEATRSTLRVLGFELRLEAAALASRGDRKTAAAARAGALDTEARAKGLFLVAERAQRLRAGASSPRPGPSGTRGSPDSLWALAPCP